MIATRLYLLINASGTETTCYSEIRGRKVGKNLIHADLVGLRVANRGGETDIHSGGGAGVRG